MWKDGTYLKISSDETKHGNFGHKPTVTISF